MAHLKKQRFKFKFQIKLLLRENKPSVLKFVSDVTFRSTEVTTYMFQRYPVGGEGERICIKYAPINSYFKLKRGFFVQGMHF